MNIARKPVNVGDNVEIGGGDIQLNADGSALFAGGNFTVSNDGVLDLQAVNESADASTLIRAGSQNATAGNSAFVLTADGSASFAGDVDINADPINLN